MSESIIIHPKVIKDKTGIGIVVKGKRWCAAINDFYRPILVSRPRIPIFQKRKIRQVRVGTVIHGKTIRRIPVVAIMIFDNNPEWITLNSHCELAKQILSATDLISGELCTDRDGLLSDIKRAKYDEIDRQLKKH